MNLKILVVDDDAEMTELLQSLLQKSGYQVETANTGNDGLQIARNFGFDLLILDWNMPDLDGIEICRSLRAERDRTPIIFLTARNELKTKEDGLDSGGDDYLTKPFEPVELLARVRAVVRRSSGMVTNDEISRQKLILNTRSRELSLKNSKVTLTATECRIMEFLIRTVGEPISSQMIFDHVWSSDSEVNADTVRVHVRILRKKLELAGFPDMIGRSRQGYQLENCE